MKTPKFTRNREKLPTSTPKLVKILTSIYAYIELLERIDTRQAGDDLLNLYGLASGSTMTVSQTGEQIRAYVKECTGQNLTAELQSFAENQISRKTNMFIDYLCRSIEETVRNTNGNPRLMIALPTPEIVNQCKEIKVLYSHKKQPEDVCDVIVPLVHMLELKASDMYNDSPETLSKDDVKLVLQTIETLNMYAYSSNAKIHRQAMMEYRVYKLRAALSFACMMTGCHLSVIRNQYGELFNTIDNTLHEVSDIGIACLPIVTTHTLNVLKCEENHVPMSTVGARYVRASNEIVW